MDIDFIYQYLSNQSYWAKGRSLELIQKSIDSSLCFAVFNSEDKQVAFARVATDYVVFAWLMDFFVDDNYRNNGIGRILIQHIVDHPELRNVNGIGLRTKDAGEFYRRFGFDEIPKPDTWMLKQNNKN